MLTYTLLINYIFMVFGLFLCLRNIVFAAFVRFRGLRLLYEELVVVSFILLFLWGSWFVAYPTSANAVYSMFAGLVNVGMLCMQKKAHWLTAYTK